VEEKLARREGSRGLEKTVKMKVEDLTEEKSGMRRQRVKRTGVN